MTRFVPKNATPIYLSIALSTTVVFVIDYQTPLGFAEWILYLVPVVLSLLLTRPVVPIIIAGLVTWLLILGFFLSPAGVLSQMAAFNRGMGALTIWTLAFVGYQLIRNRLKVQREEWIQIGQMRLSEKMLGDQRMDQLAENTLAFLCEYTNAQIGALYLENGVTFDRAAVYAVPADTTPKAQFARGEGLIGQAAKDGRTVVVRDVPEGYLRVGSSLGGHSPRQLLLVPAKTDSKVNAVLELGYFRALGETEVELLDRVRESIGVAIRSARYRLRLQELLDETQRQATELQAQSEELRVSNEELTEQSRALKESQTRLELQQTELEQTNSQLEEQTQILELQKDEISRAKQSLEQQARIVAQASRYKSDFLANMSHELRTPLNSSLILAKLLADNREGNLTPEQIKYAQTIQSAGNDLLTLINDVLDLSKVEAGHMELKPERVAIDQTLDNLRNVFQPIANQKGLKLRFAIAPGTPASLFTDPQRLQQVLKNLLSNALKFTAAGSVTLDASRAVDGRVAFAVRDTGIGIATDQHQAIFEPFCQADGTTSRKYGGTGLGLSISRELVRLLGGEIHLASEVGRGSTFTLLLPEEFVEARREEKPAIDRAPTEREERLAAGPRISDKWTPPPASQSIQGAAPAARVPDDRERLNATGRVILIAEDDETFARIVADLAREMAFQSLIATTAEEALALARQYLPSAIVLDIGLPDNSGLFVLERLKADSRTRHIPVHVVSGSDYAETALSLGAIGYILKPLKRDQLVEAFQKLETRLTQKLRRVLLVEDDPVQLDSLQQLLASREVETVGVRSAAQCLEKLKETTFDCMVLDLSLPDASGFSLLETLSAEDKYSFPPVIVYTGRELTTAQEQQLRKYSKSIIIKGAKSPERLLDEVTLFLHQVVADLPVEQQRMLAKARSREEVFENRRILIVEDDVRNIFALTSLLEPRGAKLEIARNGKEALQMLDRFPAGGPERIDLVLMDIMMPEMDGLTAIREIRKRPDLKRLPIVALTAKAMKDDQEQALGAGANDYLAKPLDVEKLLSLIRVWLSR